MRHARLLSAACCSRDPRRRLHDGRRRLDLRTGSVEGAGPERLRLGLRRTERFRQRRTSWSSARAASSTTQTTLTAPASTPFQIQFQNKDAGVPHNVSLHLGGSTGAELFKGTIFNGVETRTYDVPALDAGAYAFVCSVHPTMIGTLNVQ